MLDKLVESVCTGDYKELLRLCLTDDHMLTKQEIEELTQHMNRWLDDLASKKRTASPHFRIGSGLAVQADQR